jgi:hypothetical protein
VLHSFKGLLDYHAVAMATYGITLLENYRIQKNVNSSDLAIKHADKLMGIGLQIDSTILFPYCFNYKFYDRDLMEAPWYSAMAQGKALSLFSRLYEVTGEQKYFRIAKRINRSFSRMKPTHHIWFTCVDEDNHLWLEEYPFEAPSHVLNGMIFAIDG